jgi:hypothetical protein
MPEIPQTGGEGPFASEALISASELREFVFCSRAWWLSRQGHAVSVKHMNSAPTGSRFMR